MFHLWSVYIGHYNDYVEWMNLISKCVENDCRRNIKVCMCLCNEKEIMWSAMAYIKRKNVSRYASISCIWHCVNWKGWKKGRPTDRSGDCTKSGWWMQYLCLVDVKHTVLYFRVWEKAGRGWLWPGWHKSMQQ